MTTNDIKFVLKLDKKASDLKDNSFFKLLGSNIGHIVSKPTMLKYVNEYHESGCFNVSDLDSLSNNEKFLKEAAEIGTKKLGR